MGVALYKPGDTHEIRGTKCVREVFPTGDLDSCLSQGWKTSPAACYPTFEEVDTNDTGKLSTEEIRAAAKKAGIGNWHNKKIATLKKELGLE